jgi:hypothetical protein
MRNRRFVDRKAALALLVRDIEAGILFNNTSPRTALSSSRTLAGLALRASCRSKVDGPYRSGPCRF